jgi:hypothetical protein
MPVRNPPIPGELMPYIYIGLCLIIVIWVSSKLKILADTQRLAQFKLGLFVKFLGPGLVLQFEKGINQWMKVTVGAVGELVDSNVGRFEEKKGKYHDFPIAMTDSARIGSLIRITGFTSDRALCILNPDQRKTIQCEKCGHEMTLG